MLEGFHQEELFLETLEEIQLREVVAPYKDRVLPEMEVAEVILMLEEVQLDQDLLQ